MKPFGIAVWVVALPLMLRAQDKIQDFDSTESKFAAVDKEFSDSSVAEGPYRAFIRFTTEDAYILSTRRAPEYGRPAVQKFYGDFPAADSLVWTPIEARCSNDGSVGYTIGIYKYISKDTAGIYTTRTGKYLTVWKKQADGSLRAIADMGSPQQAVFDTSGNRISVRQALIQESTPDFLIEAGTYKIEEARSVSGGEIQRGNYITAWRLIRAGMKKVVADYQN